MLVVNDALEGETMDKWTTCVNRIEELGLEGGDAETVVGQAFGWGKQSYWLNKKKEEVPSLDQVTLPELLHMAPSPDFIEL